MDGAKFCGNCGAITEPAKPSYAAAQQTPPQSYSYPQATQHQPYAPQNYSVPSNAEPLSVGQYIGMFILMVIPVVNIILLFVWGFGGSVNPNKKNYARAMLILAAIGIVLFIIFSIALGGFIRNLFGGYIYY